MQIMTRLASLVLEDGTVFPGRAVGAAGVAAGEACFTTASTGYEEAATDPSYVAQVLCFAYPLIGNYGIDRGRTESGRVQAEAVVMRTARPAWAQWLQEQGVVAIDDVDTRALVRRIRSDGVVRCAVGEAPAELVEDGMTLGLGTGSTARGSSAYSGVPPATATTRRPFGHWPTPGGTDFAPACSFWGRGIRSRNRRRGSSGRWRASTALRTTSWSPGPCRVRRHRRT